MYSAYPVSPWFLRVSGSTIFSPSSTACFAPWRCNRGESRTLHFAAVWKPRTSGN